MRLIWNIWLDTRTGEKAAKVCNRILDLMNADALEKTTEPYLKTNGFVVRFTTELESREWGDAVVEAIDLGQRLGGSWLVGGDVYNRISGWSTHAKVPGVTTIEWIVLRE